MRSKDKIHNYQWTCYKHILDNVKCGLFLEMGLGKTVTTLTAINTLIYEELEILNALVIAPKRVAESVWAQECQEWEHLKHLKVVKIMGTENQRLQALQEKGDIYTISRNNVAWLCTHFGGLKLPFGAVVIDELSSFKSAKSIRFKTLRNAIASVDRVIGLTGTPAPNSLIDLWAQVYLLDRGERLGKTLTSYRSTYFKPGQTNGAVVYSYNLVKGCDKQIHEQIQDICISMKAADYLELPGRIDNHIKIQLPAKALQMYQDFERDQVLQFLADMNDEDEPINAVNAAALANKLLQFANGAVYDADKKYHVVHDAKIEALVELVEDSIGPVLIAWNFRHDFYRIEEALKKYKPRLLKSDQDIRDWNEGKIKILTMHPASGGHGLNLQTGGNEIIWFGQNWSLELEQQFNARLDRQGQTKPVIIHRLVSEGTIDIDVLKALKRKAATQSELMEAVKARIKLYSGKVF